MVFPHFLQAERKKEIDKLKAYDLQKNSLESSFGKREKETFLILHYF